MIRLLAEVASREHVAWWLEALRMVRSPAHWLGEFTIELFFAMFGVHALHRVAHSSARRVLRQLHKLSGRFLAKG